MAKAIKKTGELGEYYAGGSLTKEQKQVNVLYICKYLTTKANPLWTLEAACGLCGNIESECGFNPGLEEVGGSGYGLIQWTPGTIHKEWCEERDIEDYSSIDSQLAHIAHEAKTKAYWAQNSSWGTINYKKQYVSDYLKFAQSDLEPYTLACAYAWCRERPGVVQWGFNTNNINRKSTYCSGITPGSAKCKNKKTTCDNCLPCYQNVFGVDAAAEQAEVNRQTFRDIRGGQAVKWYNYYLEATQDTSSDVVPPADSDEEAFTPLTKLKTSELKVLYKSAPFVNQNYTNGLNPFEASVDDPESTDKGGFDKSKDQDVLDSGSSLPNCTAYVWGRLYQILSKKPLVFKGNAGAWYDCFSDKELEKHGYSKNSTTPAPGAIMCWKASDSNWGHVAVVEEVEKDDSGKLTGRVKFSDSGYQTWASWRSTGYINVRTNFVNPTDVYKKYDFKGYIYLPTTDSEASVMPPEITKFTLLNKGTETAEFKIEINKNDNTITNAYYLINGAQQTSFSLSAEHATFSLEKLVPNTTYTVVAAVETAYTTVISSGVVFTTEQDYPDPITDINIKFNGKCLETEQLSVNVDGPGRWGYWQSIGNDYGYLVHIISNYKLFDSFSKDSPEDSFSLIPADYGIEHDQNLQLGISTWVTDDNGEQIFAQPGKNYPVCSNSIFLQEPSDTLFMLLNNKISKVQPYIKQNTFIPLKIFKIE